MKNLLLKFLPFTLLSVSFLSAQKAALVQNVDEKGRVPFQQRYDAHCSGNYYFCTINVAVPAGQRLVVAHVNGSLSMASQPALIYAFLTSGTSLPSAASGAQYNSGTFYMPVSDLGAFPSGSHFYLFDRDTTFYVDGVNGASLQVSFSIPSNTPSAGANQEVTVAGYLVPIPATVAGN